MQITLTPRQAATVHTSAIVNFHGSVNMARYLAAMPALARCFIEEAGDWRAVGKQIETHHPTMEPHNWDIDS